MAKYTQASLITTEKGVRGNFRQTLSEKSFYDTIVARMSVHDRQPTQTAAIRTKLGLAKQPHQPRLTRGQIMPPPL
jgi:hypothetical protein